MRRRRRGAELHVSPAFRADSLEDWIQGPIEREAELEAEDAWSTATAVSRRIATLPRTEPRLGRTEETDSADEIDGTDRTPARPSHGGTVRFRPVFRSELHGLRAVALGLVAVYHIWLGRVSGGVDVFLFLSAFFLTGTFVRRLESGRPLAIPRYWLHTFKRLLPPAAVTIVLVLIGTRFLLPPSTWPDIMRQAGASAGYVQNIVLILAQVDYQARDAGASSPLQHFWSLSVQGQAFLVWPLLFLLALPFARRRRSVRRPLFAIVMLLFAASLTWSIIETATQQRIAYFDTGARMWEFAAGSLLALALPRLDRISGATRPEDELPPRFASARALLGWAGIIGLLACGIVLNVSSLFPGWLALWPLASAGAVVAAGHSGRRWGVDRLLSTRPAAFIGDISYALYLVHWPLLVLWLHRSGQQRAGLLDGLVVLACSVLLAWVLTRLVDAPIRRSAWLEARAWRSLVAIGAAAALVAGATGGWWWSLAGGLRAAPDPVTATIGPVPIDEVATSAPTEVLPAGWALDSQWPDLPHACAGRWAPSAPFPHVHCQQLLPANAETTGTLVVVGSSHARQFIPAMIDAAKARRLQIVNLSMDGCPFTTGATRYCHGYDAYALSYIDSVKPQAVLTTATITAPQGTDETIPAGGAEAIDQILSRGIPVIAARDTPRWPRDQYACAEGFIEGGKTPADADRGCGAPRDEKLPATSPLSDLKPPAGSTARIIPVDVSDAVCPHERCSPILGSTYVYLDANHLTRLFVEQALVEPFTVALADALGEPAASDAGG